MGSSQKGSPTIDLRSESIQKTSLDVAKKKNEGVRTRGDGEACIAPQSSAWLFQKPPKKKEEENESIGKGKGKKRGEAEGHDASTEST